VLKDVDQVGPEIENAMQDVIMKNVDLILEIVVITFSDLFFTLLISIQKTSEIFFSTNS
jgi:hypothetical protein